MTAAAAIAGLVLAAPAAPANFTATAEDPAGDASDASPGRDITAFGMDYDRRTGALKGIIRLRGAPGEEGRSLITLAVGMRTATGCDGYPAGILGSDSDEFGASWLRVDAPGPATESGDADKRGFDDAVQTFSAETAALAGQPYQCAVALLSEPGNAANVYDTAGPVDLVGQPALSVRVKVPKRFTPGRANRMTVRVSNPGDGPATGVRLRLSRERGLSATPRRRSLPTLAPGARRTIRVKLRLSARARDVTDLGVQVRERRLVARGTVPLRLRRPSPGGGGGGGGDPDRDFTPRSCVRYSPDLSGETGGSLILVPC